MNGCSVLRELVAATSWCSIKSLISCAYEICCTIFTQQARAWSRSCVVRMAACLLALGCLQLLMNLLQYAMTLMSLFSLENHCVMSSGRWNATCTFLISKISVGVLNSVAGRLDGSCESHCGPLHHSVHIDSVISSTPLDMRSAGLDWVGTCIHVAEAVSSWIIASLLPTNIFHLFGGLWIHVSMMEESVHK